MDSRLIFLHLGVDVTSEVVTEKARPGHRLVVVVQDRRWAGEANPSGCRKTTSRIEYEDASP